MPYSYVYAHKMPGATAGDQILTALSLLPPDGGVVDATRLYGPQSIAPFVVKRGQHVKLGPGVHTLTGGAPIVVNDGGHLYGSGVNSPGATWIKLGNGENHDVIQCVAESGNWWHNGELANFRIDGNKANNPTGGHGIAVYSLGETSVIRRVISSNNKKAGLYFKGSHAGTGTVDNVTVGSNDVAGFHIDDFKSGICFNSCGGDFNGHTFMITNANNGGGSIVIKDPKSEGIPAGGYPIYFKDSPTSAVVNLTVLGGSFLNGFGANGTVIKVDDIGWSPVINIIGLTLTNGWSTLIDDQVVNMQIPSPVPGAYWGMLSYSNGKYMKFDKNGFETYPNLICTQP
jgi:hypothetical protein